MRYVVNHSKIVTIRSDRFRLLLRGSMNLNFNPRFEQFDLTEGGEDFEMVKRIEAELPILEDSATGEDVYNKIIAKADAGKTILIIGHSNTILRIIKKFGISNYLPADIPDTEFDNLYLITYKRKKAVIKAMKYGAASSASPAMK